jgi:signal transduction histidine kinase
MPFSNGCYSWDYSLQESKIKHLRNGSSFPLPLFSLIENESVAEDDSKAVLVEMRFGKDGILFRCKEMSQKLRIDEG